MLSKLVKNLSDFLEMLQHQTASSLPVPMSFAENLIAQLKDSGLKNVPEIYLSPCIKRMDNNLKEVQQQIVLAIAKNELSKELISDWSAVIVELSAKLADEQEFYTALSAEVLSVIDIAVWDRFTALVVESSKPLIILWYFNRKSILHLVNSCLVQNESRSKALLGMLLSGLKFESGKGDKVNLCYGEVLWRLYKQDSSREKPVFYQFLEEALLLESQIFAPELQERFVENIIEYDDLLMAVALSIHQIPQSDGRLLLKPVYENFFKKLSEPTMLSWHKFLFDPLISKRVPFKIFESLQKLFPPSKQRISLDKPHKFQEFCGLLAELFSFVRLVDIPVIVGDLYKKNFSQILMKFNISVKSLNTEKFSGLLSSIQKGTIEHVRVFASALIYHDDVRDFFSAICFRVVSDKKKSDASPYKYQCIQLLIEQKLLDSMTEALKNLDRYVKPCLHHLNMESVDTLRVMLLLIWSGIRIAMEDRCKISPPQDWLLFFALIMKDRFKDLLLFSQQKPDQAMQKSFDTFLMLIKDSKYVDYLPDTMQKQFLACVKPAELSCYEQNMEALLKEEEGELRPPKPLDNKKKKKKKNKQNIIAFTSPLVEVAAEIVPSVVENTQLLIQVSSPPELEVDADDMAILEKVRSFRSEEEEVPEKQSEESGGTRSYDAQSPGVISMVSSQINDTVSETIFEPVRFNARELIASIQHLQKQLISVAWMKQLNLVIMQLGTMQDVLQIVELPKLNTVESSVPQDSTVILDASSNRLQWEKHFGLALSNYCESVSLVLDKLGAAPFSIDELLKQRLVTHLAAVSRCYFQDPALHIDPRHLAIIKKIQDHFAELNVHFFIEGTYFLRTRDAGDIDVVIAPQVRTVNFFERCDQLVRQLTIIKISKTEQYSTYRQSDVALLVGGVFQWRIGIQLDAQHTLNVDLNFWNDPLTPQAQLSKTLTAWFSACAVHWYLDGSAVMSPLAATANYNNRLAILKEPTRDEMPAVMGYFLKTMIRFSDLEADIWIRSFLASTIVPETRVADRDLLCAGVKYLLKHFDHRAFDYIQAILNQRLLPEVIPLIDISLHQHCANYFKCHFLQNTTAADFSRISAAQFFAMYFFGAIVDQPPMIKQQLFDALSRAVFCADILRKTLLLLHWMPQTTPIMSSTAIWYSWPTNRMAWLASSLPQHQEIVSDLLGIFNVWHRMIPVAAVDAPGPSDMSRHAMMMSRSDVSTVKTAPPRQGFFGGATSPISSQAVASSVSQPNSFF